MAFMLNALYRRGERVASWWCGRRVRGHPHRRRFIGTHQLALCNACHRPSQCELKEEEIQKRLCSPNGRHHERDQAILQEAHNCGCVGAKFL